MPRSGSRISCISDVAIVSLSNKLNGCTLKSLGSYHPYKTESVHFLGLMNSENWLAIPSDTLDFRRVVTL